MLKPTNIFMPSKGHDMVFPTSGFHKVIAEGLTVLSLIASSHYPVLSTERTSLTFVLFMDSDF